VDPRAGLDDVKKRQFLTLPGLEPQPLSRPARSQSLYRLRYPGSEGLGLLEKCKDFIGNRTCDPQACRIVPQPTTLPTVT
jgi:hypothetical protein